MIRRVPTGDRGTSLLIVLMIITFVSTVTGVILSQEGTSVKATETLRTVSSTYYGSDAAAQAAVTQLKNGQFACASAATSTLTFGGGSTPFYQPVGTSSGPLNAVATCTPDTTTGVTATVTGSGTMVGPANTPTAALTTVGSTAFDGILAAVGGPTFTVCVQGSVVSYTTITAWVSAGTNTKGSATACPDQPNPTTSIQAYGSPLVNPLLTGAGCGASYFPQDQCIGLATKPPPIPTVPDPGVPITVTNPAVACQTVGSKIYAAFLPGRYTQVSLLNLPCGGKAANTLEWFTPGVYYFDFGSTTWTLPATVVGGTPTNASGQPITGLNPATKTLSNLSQLPSGEGKCVPPTAQTQAGEGGVEFVFGGASTMTGMTPNILTPFTSTDMDICATYSATSPPVAIYGATQDLNEGGVTVPKQSGCVALQVCLGSPPSLLNWPLFSSIGLPTLADQTYHFDGYVWAPAAGMNLNYATAKGQAFNWGLLVRSFTTLGLTSMTMAAVPAANPGLVTTYSYSVRYVNVWTCAASVGACPQTGAPNVRIKLQQTGATWKVLSWSAPR
jgi:hypothetical protein